MGIMTINIDDNATEELLRLKKEYPKFYTRALKSLGWMAQKSIKEGIKSGAPGGKKYAEKIPAKKRRLIDHIFEREERAQYPYLGKMRKAVGYDKRYIGEGTIIIGWLSRSAVNVGTKLEKGIVSPVSRKMRYRFLIGGVKVKKSVITVPARETYTPIKPVIEKEAIDYIKKKMLQFIANPNLRGTASSKRRYRVYT